MARVIGMAEKNDRKDLRKSMGGARIVVDGAIYDLEDLSIRGFLCRGYDEPVLHGDTVRVDKVIISDDYEVDLRAEAIVTRFSSQKQYMAATFIDITNRTFSMLEKLTMGRTVPEHQRRML